MKKLLPTILVALLVFSSKAQTITISDDNFLKALLDRGVDVNFDMQIQTQEALAVTDLNIASDAISDLTEIKYFTNLKHLDCSYNQLGGLDVSKNTALKDLNCSNNYLTELDIRVNTTLSNLACSRNQISALYLNTSLTTLECDSNALFDLDLTSLTQLYYLNCSVNNIKSLDLSKNIALTSLYCFSNSLASLDVSKNSQLDSLTCYSNLRFKQICISQAQKSDTNYWHKDDAATWSTTCAPSSSPICPFLSTWGFLGTEYAFGAITDTMGNIYVSDGYTINKFDDQGILLKQWGSGGQGNGQFSVYAFASSIDASGNVYVTDFGNSRVQKFNSNGIYLTQFGGYGNTDGKFIAPSATAIDKAGNIYVADSTYRIQKFSSNGTYLGKFNYQVGDLGYNLISDMLFDVSGNLVIGDAGNSRIQKLSTDGAHLGNWSVGHPYDLASDKEGNVWVATFLNGDVVEKYSAEGVYLGYLGTGIGDQEGEFNGPAGVAVGKQGTVYVVDGRNIRVEVFSCENGLGIYTPGMLETMDLLYPNPSAGVFQWKEEMQNIRVSDMAGRIVLQKSNPEKQLDLRDQPKGLYFAEITKGDKRVVQKLIVE